jgi:hypothetical protein
MTALERQVISSLFYIECDLRVAAERLALRFPESAEELRKAANVVRYAIKQVEGGKS